VGSPRKIKGNFACDFNNLLSLEGFPEQVDGNVFCDDIFTREQIREVCDVKGCIILVDNNKN
jgi:hypothetical protein